MEFDSEHWKPSPIFPGRYLISDKGEVYNIEKNMYVSQMINTNGYPVCWLYCNGKEKLMSVHRLVAMAFIPNPDNKPFVDHINTIRADNRVANLRWATNKENLHNELTYPKVKATALSNLEKCNHNRQKVEIYKNEVLIGVFDSQMQAAEFLGVSNGAITRYCSNEFKNKQGYVVKRVCA